MLLAAKDGKRIKAQLGKIAKCPGCNSEVIPKCGTIKIWHWAHKANECIYHTEPETEWHLQWKEEAMKYGCNIEMRFGEHIADAVIKNKIIEFQHSNITSEEIISRSIFYINVDWVFDYRDKAGNIEFYIRNYEAEKREHIAKAYREQIVAVYDNMLSYLSETKSLPHIQAKPLQNINPISGTTRFKLGRKLSIIDSLFKLYSPLFGKVYLDITKEEHELKLLQILKLADGKWGEGVIIENPRFIFQ